MATTFITRNPVPRDLNPKSTDIIFADPEMSMVSARQALADELKAFRDKGIHEGDIVYVTVCYSDGHFKPGNIRNDRRTVKYKKAGDQEFVSLLPIFEGK